MARCCGSAGTCACKVEAGRQVAVTGSGTAQDPFVFNATTALNTEDTTTFDLSLFGVGTLDQPWVLRVDYAATARLDDLPDVNAASPNPGDVVTWDDVAGEWVSGPAATATPGAVLSSNGLDGDGSGGDPLVAVGEDARYIRVTGSGIGLSDAGLNRILRPFADEAARAAASPAVTEGAITVLQDDPSILWYFDGTEHVPVTGGIGMDVRPGQLLALSGPYAGGVTTRYIAQVNAVTDGTGAFVVIPSGDLADYSGVLSVYVQPTDTFGWHCSVQPGAGIISGVARRLDTGALYTGVTVTAVVEAVLY